MEFLSQPVVQHLKNLFIQPTDKLRYAIQLASDSRVALLACLPLQGWVQTKKFIFIIARPFIQKVAASPNINQKKNHKHLQSFCKSA